MVRWKGRIAPKTSDIPVSSLDLFPTILKACEVKAPADLPGLNLADESALLTRTALYGECYTHDFVDLGKAAPNLRWRWMLQEGWKLIVPAPPNERGGAELYRLTDDLREEKNLVDTETERVNSLRSKLDAWWPGVEVPR
jgi:arylsulfatase A-like enzyme